MLLDFLSFLTAFNGDTVTTTSATATTKPSTDMQDFGPHAQNVDPTMKIAVVIPEATGLVETAGNETVVSVDVQFSDTDTFATIAKTIPVCKDTKVSDVMEKVHYTTLPGGKLPRYGRMSFTVTKGGSNTVLKIRGFLTPQVPDHAQAYWN